MNIVHLYHELNSVNSTFLRQLNRFGQESLNTRLYKDSWSAAQVGEHIRKSDMSIASCLALPGETCMRDPFERVNEMREIFMDFSLKMKSPDFVDPGQVKWNAGLLSYELAKTFQNLYAASARENLLTSLNHVAFGEITKIELLYFIIYHTRRHIHQLENIHAMLRIRKAGSFTK